jgi:hypothetical protein
MLPVAAVLAGYVSFRECLEVLFPTFTHLGLKENTLYVSGAIRFG